MQLIYSESFTTMIKACKIIQEQLDMGSKVLASFLAINSAHLCRCSICMPRHVAGHGDQSGSKVSQLYFHWQCVSAIYLVLCCCTINGTKLFAA